MNVLCLVQKAANQRFLEAALQGVGVTNVRFESTWDAFMQSILADRPDLVLLEHDALERDGKNQIVAAAWALKAMALPRVVVLRAGEEAKRYELEVTTDLEHFVFHPFAQDELVTTISAAVGHEAWLTAESMPAVFEVEFDPASAPGTGRQLTIRAADRGVLPQRGSESASRNDQPTLEVPTVPETAPLPFRQDPAPDPGDVSAFPFGDQVALEMDDEPLVGFEALIDQHYRAETEAPRSESPSSSVTWGREGPSARISQRHSTPTGMRFAVEEDEAPLAPDRQATVVQASPAEPSSSMPPVEQEAVAPPAPPARPATELALVALPSGKIEAGSVPQVLYACAVTARTGRLLLTQGGLRREILFLNGMPGRADATSTQDEVGRMLSAFTWTSGEYVFEEEPISKLGFLPYGDVLDLLYRGLERYVGMNELAALLASCMRLYPVYTTLFERMSRAGSLASVRDVLRRIDGSMTFERGIVGLGADPETALRVVYLGALTGLVVFSNMATEAPHEVSLVRTESKVTSAPRAVTSQPTPSQRPEERTTARVTISPEQATAFAMLREMERRLATLSPNEALGLASGVTEQMATTRFQELIRAHHPDRFASLGNPDLQALAHKVFFELRSSFQKVRSGAGGGAEAQSAVPRSTGPQRAVADSGRPVVAGGAGSGAAGTAPRSTGEHAAVGRSGDESSRTGRVNDALERLRRATGQHAAIPPRETTGSGAATPQARRATVVGGLSVDQLVRNALRALEGDAIEKAAELVDQSRKKGGGHPLIPVMEAYIAYRQDEISARKALKVLEEHIETLESNVSASQALIFSAHIQRLEEELDEAQRLYQKAAERDRANAEATRWIRYLRSRGDREKPSGGFLNKLLNTKITLSGKPK